VFFTVIIPAFKRDPDLAVCLRAVLDQTFPPDGVEILVVDNAGLESTRQLCERIDPRVGYLREERKGLHFSRHAGARAATGEWLAFTDDDARPDPNWLEALHRRILEQAPDACGGAVRIEWDHPPEAWVERFEGFLGRLDLGPDARVLSEGEQLNGANFCIRRDRLFEIGGFDPDQIGDRLIGDGETGLCRRMLARHWKLWWVPGATVAHRQQVGRHGTEADMERRYWNNGVCEAYRQYREGTWRIWHLWEAAWQHRRKAAAHARVSRRRTGENARQHRFLAAGQRGQSYYFAALARHPQMRRIARHENWILNGLEWT